VTRRCAPVDECGDLSDRNRFNFHLIQTLLTLAAVRGLNSKVLVKFMEWLSGAWSFFLFRIYEKDTDYANHQTYCACDYWKGNGTSHNTVSSQRLDQ
jgi:hypothetical protein